MADELTRPSICGLDTSLAGTSTDVVTVVVYGGYAALAEIGGHPGAFAILMMPCVAVAVVLVANWRR